MGNVILFIFLLCVSLSTVEAESCDKICEWTPWKSWSDCDHRCAGGIKWRSRSMCCKLELAHSSELCMKDCNFDYSAMRSRYHDRQGCNQHCYNGGTFTSTWFEYCRCPTRYRGTCCEDVVTCGRPSSISHGSFSGSDFTYAGRIQYTCDKNYNMTNPARSSRTCTSGGYWSGSAPTCSYATSCNSSPCQNGARCENLLGDYRCVCLPGWSGKNCEVDVQPPIVQGCPADRNIVTSNLTSTQRWTEPNITDPHGKLVTITTNYPKGEFNFPWGKFTVQYSGVKPSNGLRVECIFNISVTPNPCQEMDAPTNGMIICNGWRREYSRVCVFACKQNYALPLGYKSEDIYVCGATGNWLPANPVPHCISKDLFPTNKVQTFPSCTASSDRKMISEYYLQSLSRSALYRLCQDHHPKDCKPENVDIRC